MQAIVLDELLMRPPSELPDLDTYPLPKGLSGLYHSFLTRELGKDDSRWFKVFEPLLGLIAVAQGDGLTTEQLTDLVGKDVREALRASKQYLIGELPDGPFRPFHKSFADFLLEDPHNLDYHIDAASMHTRIVSSYRATAAGWATVDWGTADAYGLRHLADHLYALSSDPNYRNLLYEFVNRPVILAKWQRFGSIDSLTTDLKLAMNAAAQESPLNWVDFMRCYLFERILGSFELSADLMKFIASSVAQTRGTAEARKTIDRALDLASSIRVPDEKARTLSTIATCLYNIGFIQDAKEIAEQAFAETRVIDNLSVKSETLSALILNMARVKQLEYVKEVASKALSIAQSISFNWSKAISISSVACALSQIGEEALAKQAFSEALEAAFHVEDGDDRAYALCAVGAAMEQAGEKGAAEDAFRNAVSQFYSSGAPDEIEDEFRSIYVDYRAKFGQNLDSLFSKALEISDRAQRGVALRRLAERLAKMLLYGSYPRESGGDLNIDRLCDRGAFHTIVSEETELSVVSDNRLTLCGLCEAILDSELITRS
jgi:tetratricopeptide (TPR) repeat protein